VNYSYINVRNTIKTNGKLTYTHKPTPTPTRKSSLYFFHSAIWFWNLRFSKLWLWRLLGYSTILMHPHDWGSKLLENVNMLLPEHMVSHPWKWQFLPYICCCTPNTIHTFSTYFKTCTMNKLNMEQVTGCLMDFKQNFRICCKINYNHSHTFLQTNLGWGTESHLKLKVLTFNDEAAVAQLHSNGWQWMTNWKRFGRESLGHNLRYYNSIYLEGLRKTFKTFSQDNQCPKVWIGHLWNISQQHHCFNQPAHCVIWGFIQVMDNNRNRGNDWKEIKKERLWVDKKRMETFYASISIK